ncbi:MAG TPA: M15 family metallopeptidase [Gemmatimonadales bacterium]|nr:M15 family metallopeptidase [Gemmatimonadales bacterium]
MRTLILLAGLTPAALAAQTVPPKPAPVPDRWVALIGAYGSGGDTLLVYEAEGQLRTRLAGAPRYPLVELADTAFLVAMGGERLIFRRDTTGRVREAELAGSAYLRLTPGPEERGQLRVTPVRPVDSLLVAARAATPPRAAGRFREPDLVDLATLDSTIRLDIRYATPDNFLGTVFYGSPRAFLQRPAAEALVRAHRKLRAQGYGLLIHDAYRPWYVTKVFWDATPDSLHWLVADPAEGSRHNRGCAVDLTLYDLATGRPIEMVGTYDEASPRSGANYPGGTSLQRWHRDLLRRAMEAEGFAVYPAEWWHFDYREWRAYPVLNVALEDLGPR